MGSKDTRWMHGGGRNEEGQHGPVGLCYLNSRREQVQSMWDTNWEANNSVLAT